MSEETELKYIRRDLDKLDKMITDGFAEVNARIEVLQKGYVTKEDFKSELKEIKKDNEKKVDHLEFEPFKVALSRINWMLITAVVGAVLALIIPRI